MHRHFRTSVSRNGCLAGGASLDNGNARLDGTSSTHIAPRTGPQILGRRSPLPRGAHGSYKIQIVCKESQTLGYLHLTAPHTQLASTHTTPPDHPRCTYQRFSRLFSLLPPLSQHLTRGLHHHKPASSLHPAERASTTARIGTGTKNRHQRSKSHANALCRLCR